MNGSRYMFTKCNFNLITWTHNCGIKLGNQHVFIQKFEVSKDTKSTNKNTYKRNACLL